MNVKEWFQNFSKKALGKNPQTEVSPVLVRASGSPIQIESDTRKIQQSVQRANERGFSKETARITMDSLWEALQIDQLL